LVGSALDAGSSPANPSSMLRLAVSLLADGAVSHRQRQETVDGLAETARDWVIRLDLRPVSVGGVERSEVGVGPRKA